MFHQVKSRRAARLNHFIPQEVELFRRHASLSSSHQNQNGSIVTSMSSASHQRDAVSVNSTQRHQNARNVTYLKDILLKAVLITIKPVNLESGLLMSRRPHHRVQDSVEKLSPPLVYDVASVQPVIQERKKKRTASERASEREPLQRKTKQQNTAIWRHISICRCAVYTR